MLGRTYGSDAHSGNLRSRDLLRAWRRGAVMVGREQWRLFYDGPGFNKQYRSLHEDDLAAVIGAANRLQMVRYQVVGILASFLSNRQNEFSRIVECSSLPKETRHQLQLRVPGSRPP